jgi:phosphate transport system substrate-binding protein
MEGKVLTRFIRFSSAALGLFGALATLNPALAETLKVGGTGAVTEMLRQIAPAFETETGIALDVIPSLGTGGANAAVADGVLGISLGGRDLKKKEVERGLTVAATFRTPFGLVTPRQGPDSLKSAEIADLYRADKPSWPDGNPILIVLRPAEESDNMLLGDLFPRMSEAIKHARTRNDLSLAATDQDNLEMAEKVKGSLVGASLTQMTTEKRNLRFVAIDGVAPSLENYENGSYPYGKTLYLVVPSQVSPEASAFLSFIATPAGESLLRKAGIVAGSK